MFLDGGVDIIIALGHSGYEMDLKIAKEVEDIDVVVGGHSHSFLFTGKSTVSSTGISIISFTIRKSTIH